MQRQVEFNYASLRDLVKYLNNNNVFLDVVICAIELKVLEHKKDINALHARDYSALKILEHMLSPLILEMRLSERSNNLTTIISVADQSRDFFADLPQELILKIISQLPFYDFIAMFQVSNSFSQITRDKQLEFKSNYLHCKSRHLIFKMKDPNITLEKLAIQNNFVSDNHIEASEDRLLDELDGMIDHFPRFSDACNKKYCNTHSWLIFATVFCGVTTFVTLMSLFGLLGYNVNNKDSKLNSDGLILTGAITLAAGIATLAATGIKTIKDNNNRNLLCNVREDVSRFFSQRRLVKHKDELYTSRTQGPSLQAVVILQ